MIYLKVNMQIERDEIDKPTILERILKFILPVANPDFEDSINHVNFWFLEFQDKKSIPSREVGTDMELNVIMKIPYLANYGYWLDNNLTYLDFIKLFDCEDIDKNDFETLWNSVLVTNKN